MNGSLEHVELQRARWRRYRSAERLLLADEDFARGGLARDLEPDVRWLVLPADVCADAVPLDEQTTAWLKRDRGVPYGGLPQSGGLQYRATSSAIIRHPYCDHKSWPNYEGIHRHGGIEAAHCDLARTMPTDGLRVFLLRHIVAVTWTLLALQQEAVENWHIEGPFELTVSLRNTAGATCGGFAEGWKQPGDLTFHPVTSVEPHAQLRFEFDETPSPEEVAMSVGERIENVFGTTGRRHIANSGRWEGNFDPRVDL